MGLSLDMLLENAMMVSDVLENMMKGLTRIRKHLSTEE